MSKLLEIDFIKTYATKANAIKAFQAKFGDTPVRYMIVPVINDKQQVRFGVLAVGQTALQEMVHFHFNVVS